MTDGELRAITFDATGTLIHAPRLGEIYSEVLARHGYNVEPPAARDLCAKVWRELSLTVGRGEDRFASHPGGAAGWWRGFLDRVCAHLGGPPPSRFAAAELFDRFSRADAWELFPDVLPTVDGLRRRGFHLAVIAHWDERLPPLLHYVARKLPGLPR